MKSFNFKLNIWQKEINTRDFLQTNYTPYDGDSSFLSPATTKTIELWDELNKLIIQEKKQGILDLDVQTPSSITSHKNGYIDKSKEIIVGLQTDAPLKRAIKPNGGIRLVEKAAEAYGYKIPSAISEIYYKYRKTHNDGVFSAYGPDQYLLRKKHILTGLPDNYGRGRIIGDYRRIPLYGVDRLIKHREQILKDFSPIINDDNIRKREENHEQIKALQAVKIMAESYGYDISQPAKDTKEAIQWFYFVYLAAV